MAVYLRTFLLLRKNRFADSPLTIKLQILIFHINCLISCQGVFCLLLRPVDDSGDILPVLSSSALVSGSFAVTQLVRDRLNLLSGEWWENPA